MADHAGQIRVAVPIRGIHSPGHNSFLASDTVRVLAESLRRSVSTVCLGIVVCTLAGCASWWKREPVVRNLAAEHYKQVAERISYSDADGPSGFHSPSLGRDRELVEPTAAQRWPITLSEAIALGLTNNEIIRQNGQFLSPGNSILANPEATPSVFDQEIQDSGVLFGTRGRDAALSDFDPRLTTNMLWGRDENAQNNSVLSGGLPPGGVLTDETAQFQTRLEQQLLTGGTVALNHTWNYSLSNQPNRLFDSAYSGTLGAEFRQPLWAGSGREFTAIAGPSTQRARGFSYVNQGIVIAQINGRLSAMEFQEQLQNLVREIGELYWDLHESWQAFEAEQAMVKAARGLWDEVTARFDAQLVSGAEEAQVEDAYHDAIARQDDALSVYFQTEARLKRMLGVSLDEERIIVPVDVPIEQEVKPERTSLLFEALVNRMELRKQKTNIYSIELQLSAAKKLMNPRLDLVAGYRLNGFGDKLIASSNVDGITQEGFNSAYGSLLRGKETAWDLGFEYSIPLWLRAEKAQVRQLEVRLLKARTTLSAQEDEIAHELNAVLQTMQRWYRASQTYRKRYLAANRRVEAAHAEYRTAGRTSSEPVLRAEMSLTQAQVTYHRSIGEYNKALRDLLYRTGRILTEGGIQILGTDGLPLIPTAPASTDETAALSGESPWGLESDSGNANLQSLEQSADLEENREDSGPESASIGERSFDRDTRVEVDPATEDSPAVE